MKYKDAQNKVHEIQDGFQHLMAGWPDGYTAITDEEAAALLVLLPADPEPVTPYTVLREAAYRLESDPLFFQEQRGEVPVGTSAAKVAEIKLRIPKI